jgi:translation initiation factor 2 beta subunit (eIF-2beta)/eIF-5
MYSQLGTTGSLDEEGKLVMKGFWKEAHLEKVVIRYREIYGMSYYFSVMH